MDLLCFLLISLKIPHTPTGPNCKTKFDSTWYILKLLFGSVEIKLWAAEFRTKTVGASGGKLNSFCENSIQQTAMLTKWKD